MRASCLVISAEPIQECSTSPAGNGPAWHVQRCSCKIAALCRAHCVRVTSFHFPVMEALHQAGAGAWLAFCTMFERSPKAFTQCTCNAATPCLDSSSMQATRAQQHQALESDGALGMIAYRNGPLQFLAQAQLLRKDSSLFLISHSISPGMIQAALRNHSAFINGNVKAKQGEIVMAGQQQGSQALIRVPATDARP